MNGESSRNKVVQRRQHSLRALDKTLLFTSLSGTSLKARTVLCAVLFASLSVNVVYAVQKSGVIRRNGCWVVPPKVGPIISLGGDRFVYSKRRMPELIYDVCIVEPDGHQWLVPQSAAIECDLIPPIALMPSATHPEVLFYAVRAGKYGLVTEQGRFILEPDFDVLGDVAEGHLIGAKAGRLLVFDENGNLTGSTNRFRIVGRSKFSGGIAPVYDEHRKVGFINFKAELVLPCQYDSALAQPGGLTLVDHAKLIDGTGQIVKTPVPLPNPSVELERSYVVLEEVVAGDKKRLGVRSATNKQILPCEYDQIWRVPGGFLAEQNSRFLLFDKDGKVTLKLGPETVDVRVGADPLIGVETKVHQRNEKTAATLWGFVDRRSGKFVIKPQYVGTLFFEQGLAMAGILDKLGDPIYGLIDKSGAWVMSPQFNSITPGKNLFSVIVPEPHFFSPDTWKESSRHYNDLVKLFRDRHVIGMSRTELISLLGQPSSTRFDYVTYVVTSGIDTATVIDFALDSNSKILGGVSEALATAPQRHETVRGGLSAKHIQLRSELNR